MTWPLHTPPGPSQCPPPTFHLTLQQWSTLFAGQATVPTGCCCPLYTRSHPNRGHRKGTLFVFPSPTQISNPQGSLSTERETLRKLLHSSLCIIYSLFPAPSTTLRCSGCAMNVRGVNDWKWNDCKYPQVVTIEKSFCWKYVKGNFDSPQTHFGKDLLYSIMFMDETFL